MWESYLVEWASEDGLHPGEAVLAALAARLPTAVADQGAYYSPGLAGATEEDELPAIENGQTRQTASGL